MLVLQVTLAGSKSVSGGVLCIFGSHTFVQVGWSFEKQTAVSHSGTEAEVISLDGGLRLDGFLHQACGTSCLMCQNHKHRAT